MGAGAVLGQQPQGWSGSSYNSPQKAVIGCPNQSHLKPGNQREPAYITRGTLRGILLTIPSNPQQYHTSSLGTETTPYISSSKNWYSVEHLHGKTLLLSMQAIFDAIHFSYEFYTVHYKETLVGFLLWRKKKPTFFSCQHSFSNFNSKLNRNNLVPHDIPLSCSPQKNLYGNAWKHPL